VWYKKFDESTKREYFEINNYKTKIPGETELSRQEHEKMIEQNIDPSVTKNYSDKE
jgi:hypothetical protein